MMGNIGYQVENENFILGMRPNWFRSVPFRLLALPVIETEAVWCQSQEREVCFSGKDS